MISAVSIYKILIKDESTYLRKKPKFIMANCWTLESFED